MLVIEGLFGVQRGQSGIVAQVGQNGINAFPAAGDGAVDAFLCQQQGAFHILFQHHVEQWLPQLLKILESHEFIKRTHYDRGAGRIGHIVLAVWSVNPGRLISGGDSSESHPGIKGARAVQTKAISLIRATG